MQQLGDFEINLAAGLAILLLEVMLLTILVPLAIDRWNRRRWRRPRLEFVTSLLGEQQPIFDRLASRAKRLFDDTGADAGADLEKWNHELYGPFFAPATASLEALMLRLPDELPIYAVSLTPDAHRDLVAWRSALLAFHAAFTTLHVVAWTHVVALPQPELFRSGEAFADVIRRFEDLNQASARLLKSAGLPKEHHLGHRVVSLLPADNFRAENWGWASSAMLRVAADRKLTLRNP